MGAHSDANHCISTNGQAFCRAQHCVTDCRAVDRDLCHANCDTDCRVVD
jgi:hypothetical protein